LIDALQGDTGSAIGNARAVAGTRSGNRHFTINAVGTGQELHAGQMGEIGKGRIKRRPFHIANNRSAKPFGFGCNALGQLRFDHRRARQPDDIEPPLAFEPVSQRGQRNVTHQPHAPADGKSRGCIRIGRIRYIAAYQYQYFGFGPAHWQLSALFG
jgi:hypothetical protein